LAFCIPVSASADIVETTRCQKRFARHGARFAIQSVKSALKCANAISECQIECEQGVYGPPCTYNPPPCCDPDDPNSNAAFGECMADAGELCDEQAVWIAGQDQKKQVRITSGCEGVTQEELCGGEAPGLNFAMLNAGCEAIIQGYECSLENLLDCVGGPLQQMLGNQIAALLDPRAAEGFAALNIDGQFPGIPIARKVTQTVSPGNVDIWTITGQAGDEIRVTVKTKDPSGSSTLAPLLTLLGTDGTTPVDNTSIVEVPCPVPTVCGENCPQLQRRFPFSGDFYLAIGASPTPGCGGGEYQMVVITPDGAQPTLFQDDVPPPY
jgi:hypothetical protein